MKFTAEEARELVATSGAAFQETFSKIISDIKSRASQGYTHVDIYLLEEDCTYVVNKLIRWGYTVRVFNKYGDTLHHTVEVSWDANS